MPVHLRQLWCPCVQSVNHPQYVKYDGRLDQRIEIRRYISHGRKQAEREDGDADTENGVSRHILDYVIWDRRRRVVSCQEKRPPSELYQRSRDRHEAAGSEPFERKR